MSRWRLMSLLRVPWSGLCVIDQVINLPNINIHFQLMQNETLSKEVKSKVTRLVYLVIGTGILTGIFFQFL